MLSNEAFIGALRLTIIGFFLTCTLGLFFIFQGKKTKAKLLLYFGLTIFCTSISGGFAPFIDFMTILITGDNMNVLLFHYITWTPVPIGLFFGGYILAEILIPNKKSYAISIFLALNIFFLLDLYIFHWTPLMIEPLEPSGETLINSRHISNFSMRWWYFSWSIAVIGGIGILFKSIGMEGLIRKKYYYLSAWNILLGLSQLLRVGTDITKNVIGDYVYSIIYWSSLIFSYLGLRAEPEERKKKVKKKITTKDSLFRIIERPEHISEEEVTYYREQKICLVCKGNVTGFNVFICPNCEALYHEDCARALTNSDNSCWVCNEPIDKK